MRALKRHVADFLRQGDGPTAVEYAVLVALLLVVCLVALLTLGQDSGGTLTSVGNTIENSTGS
jgi:pilus assembly protein Flp/PilA